MLTSFTAANMVIHMDTLLFSLIHSFILPQLTCVWQFEYCSIPFMDAIICIYFAGIMVFGYKNYSLNY